MRYIIIFFITVKLFSEIYTLENDPFMDADYKEIVRFEAIPIVNAQIDSRANKTLESVLSKIELSVRKNDDFLVSIIGHAALNKNDNKDTQEESMLYAKKVESFFLDRNISKVLLVVQAHGSKYPLYLQTTKKDIEESARVMLALYVLLDKDSDYDGVRDKDDKCRDSKYFDKVNKFGCLRDITVVLVPNKKDHNAIEVSTAKAKQLVDKDNYAVKLYSMQEEPSKPNEMSIEEIRAMFPYITSRQELGVKKYTLYFSEDSSLTKASQVEFEEIKRAIKAIPNALLTINGYTDTKGSISFNKELSKKRVETLQTSLDMENIKYLRVEKNYYGEENLAVPTADDVDEVLNRRIEILIR